MEQVYRATEEVLLKRQGTIYVPSGSTALPDSYLEQLELDLVDLGYAISSQLRTQLQSLSLDALRETHIRIGNVLRQVVGGNQKHKPLFRRFPDQIPDDTFDLWCRKVLTHFMQEPKQPCLNCHRVGTTHVLNPCRHVVCDHCFDGANYSACPVCERHVDQSSPFFKPSHPVTATKSSSPLKLLNLGVSLEADARTFFVSICERKQAISPADKDDFVVIVREFGLSVLNWLPEDIPVRENIATLFGTLLRTNAPEVVMAAAKLHISTATDVLRLIAAYSGADCSLQGQTIYRERKVEEIRNFSKFKKFFASWSGWARRTTIPTLVVVKRFKVAKLSRAFRRTLLGFMDGLHPESLTEDMLRHRSYWVWLGQFLHPAEYKTRFPNVARAFEIIRQNAPDGTLAPEFHGYYAKLEAAVQSSNVGDAVGLLSQRPGELARRFDHVLRVAGENSSAIEQVMTAFSASMANFSTPVLLTLRAHLPTRTRKLRTRIFWPKGQVAKGVFSSDKRATLRSQEIQEAVTSIELELLRRFSQKAKFDNFIIDRALAEVIFPFNERTASKSAIQLPRGSSLYVPAGKKIRLFLHWCEPEKNGDTTDLDLSIGFYDQNWQYQGVCSYYQLKYIGVGEEVIATSSGDLRDAPFPDGASEFVDLNCDAAMAQGIRYAVAVLNNYSGLAFEQLERAFAGVMFRDDVHGEHFDPRTVELKFDLQGGNGTFLPFVLDLVDNRLHWLDVYSSGEFQFNNVATSNSAIVSICPTMIDYFKSGVRTSMFDVALLNAAARANKVFFRGDETKLIERKLGEDDQHFLQRLRAEVGEQQEIVFDGLTQPVCAILAEGDVELPLGSMCYALKRGRVTDNLSASDLIS